MTTFSGNVYNAFKETLDNVIDDSTDGIESSADFVKWCEVGTMKDAFVDDLEMGGPGYAYEKTEGQDISSGDIKEGYMTRYWARTFGLRIQVSEETSEDVKYDKVLMAGKRAKRALWKTADVEATNMLQRATNTAFVGGDGQPLASASHSLPNGGTFSNQMATPLSASRAAMISAVTSIRKMVGHDGTIEGYEPKAILCPIDQWATWQSITQSKISPEAGNFSEINVINKLGLDVHPLKYWTNSTTNWCVRTDVENGIKFNWRRKPRSRSWVENSQEVMTWAVTARWARNWSDPRSIFFVNA